MLRKFFENDNFSVLSEPPILEAPAPVPDFSILAAPAPGKKGDSGSATLQFLTRKKITKCTGKC